MLEIKELTKIYKTGKVELEALKKVSINFRKNEFVSILGPSGCGKTTLLNMIGGLDKYTSGEILIDGKSTKEYKNKDWDNYRNKRVGFIFQSYNLIPHQTILENVALTLTIANIKKKERIQKAKEALDKVGLKDLYYKKPTQLSGGQCQRVAIARAIINEPEILLADEPTGALDTKTSIQIMEIIKEISKERLVIMVTHNPELATEYSTRIIKLKDGELIEDTDPYTIEVSEKKEEVKKKKSRLGFGTAFKLSAKNLMTKKGRTALTCLAGSIGIIGVGLVLATSKGVQNFIYSNQDDIIYFNPIQASEKSINFSSLYRFLAPKDKRDLIEGKVTVTSIIEEIRKKHDGGEEMYIQNKLTKDYITYADNITKDDSTKDSILEVYKDYGINLEANIFTDYNITELDKENVSLANIKSDLVYTTAFENPTYKAANMETELGASDFIRRGVNEDVLKKYTHLIAGTYPKNPNELILNIGEFGRMKDTYLARLGFYKKKEFVDIMFGNGEGKFYFDYNEIFKKDFYYYPNDDIYKYNKTEDRFTLDIKKPAREGYKLKIVGIVETKTEMKIPVIAEDGPVGAFARAAGLLYTEKFEEKVLRDCLSSKIVEYGLEKDKEVSFQEYKFDNIDATYSWYKYDNSTKVFTNFQNKLPVTKTLREVGAREIPRTVSFITKTYSKKKNITKYLDRWNLDNEEIVVEGKVLDNSTKVFYNDSSAFLLNTIEKMTDVVSLGLIIFTSLSLLVSSVMIAVITYISVVERVKEIGTIRAIGGRKMDITKLFNSETVIIGTISGLIGVTVTGLSTFVINIIIKQVTEYHDIVTFSPLIALLMFTLSVVLTVVSGIIPSFLAAKKDPVEALRSI